MSAPRLTTTRVRRAAGSAPAALLAVLTLAALLLGSAGPASAVPARDVTLPPAGHPWYGPDLDWTRDLPADYARRLGETPSLYGQRVHYPLTDDDATYLQQFAQQSSTQGAVALLTLEPQVGLDDLTKADAGRLADELAGLHHDYDVDFLVRFAPEMNGSWVTWGQQPQAYRRAFRIVADAVHGRVDLSGQPGADPAAAVMVWAPAYGAGYPFGGAYGAVNPLSPGGTLSQRQLDTNHDGTVDDADDPYGPYYPGADYVDWVGLSLYRYGLEQQFGANTVPEANEYADRLDDTWGYGQQVSRQSFYQRFAESAQTPMLVVTGALYSPQRGGADELSIKQTWWRQVFAADAGHPLIRAVDWLELSRNEDEAGGRQVDWGATRTLQLARALRGDLASSELTLGPVTRVLDQQAANTAIGASALPSTRIEGSAMGWLIFCAVLLGVAFLLAGLIGKLVPSWRYVDDGRPRDARIDLFRGWIIVTVVVTHIELAGVWSYVSLNAIGAITGAEMFVLLSGVVLGMVNEPAVRRAGEWVTAKAMWLRARKQYVVSLAVVLVVYLLGLMPFVNGTAITTFTDRGTGSDGASAQGTVYDLYANAHHLLDYPPPWYAVKQLLLLDMGPWVFNIMGLFVMLSLLVPLLMFLVRRGWWWGLLAVSWALFVYGTIVHPHLISSQFEDAFPILLWQLPFVHGLVLGHYRQQITAALTSRIGKPVTAAFVIAYCGGLGYLWLMHHAGRTPTPLPAGSYEWLYYHAYTRVFLQPGRLIDLVLMIVVAFAVLTTCWKPINAAIGWLWTPLGQASLYVFIVHVFFALAVANLWHLNRTDFWLGTAIHTVVVLLIWVMVKRKVLFSVIPR